VTSAAAVTCPLCLRECADGLALYTHTEMMHIERPKPRSEAVVDGGPGRKDDTGKPRFDLMPLHAYKAVIDVLTYGAGKYAPENWRKVEGWRWRYYRAALGHIWKWAAGEWLDTDPDAAGNVSNLPHLAHACCCLLFILELDTSEGEKK
jgi:hypothetical protein